MNKVMVIIMIAVIDRCYHYNKTLLTLEGKVKCLPLKNT